MTQIPTEVLFAAINEKRRVWGDDHIRQVLIRDADEWMSRRCGVIGKEWMDLGCHFDADDGGWDACPSAAKFSAPSAWRRFDDELEALAFSMGVDVDALRPQPVVQPP